MVRSTYTRGREFYSLSWLCRCKASSWWSDWSTVNNATKPNLYQYSCQWIYKKCKSDKMSVIREGCIFLGMTRCCPIQCPRRKKGGYICWRCCVNWSIAGVFWQNKSSLIPSGYLQPHKTWHHAVRTASQLILSNSLSCVRQTPIQIRELSQMPRLLTIVVRPIVEDSPFFFALRISEVYVERYLVPSYMPPSYHDVCHWQFKCIFSSPWYLLFNLLFVLEIALEPGIVSSSFALHKEPNLSTACWSCHPSSTSQHGYPIIAHPFLIAAASPTDSSFATEAYICS